MLWVLVDDLGFYFDVTAAGELRFTPNIDEAYRFPSRRTAEYNALTHAPHVRLTAIAVAARGPE